MFTFLVTVEMHIDLVFIRASGQSLVIAPPTRTSRFGGVSNALHFSITLLRTYHITGSLALMSVDELNEETAGLLANF